MTTFFLSDTHYSHSAIITYCDRGFKDVGEMNEALIRNYQEVVRPGDDVYHLGDFAMWDHLNILRRLPGNKHLILGNHDYKHRKKLRDSGLFIWIKDTFQLKTPTEENPRQTIWLSHYSHQTWPQKGKGAWHLFGHSHGNLPGIGMSFDVGVDCCDYSPISLEQVKKRFKKLQKTDEQHFKQPKTKKKSTTGFDAAKLPHELQILNRDAPADQQELQCCDGARPNSKPISFPVNLIPDGEFSIVGKTPDRLMEVSLCELCLETIISSLLKRMSS